VTGDLVYSSLRTLIKRPEARRALGIGSKETSVVFMPGSREFEVAHMLPVFLKVIEDLSEERADLKVFLLKSPYVGEELLRSSLAMGGRIREAESLPGDLVERAGGISRLAVRLPSGKLVP